MLQSRQEGGSHEGLSSDRRGPGTGESADDDFDELTMERLFHPVATLWELLGAVEDGRLTPLGWWGLPEAIRRVWAPSPGA